MNSKPILLYALGAYFFYYTMSHSPSVSTLLMCIIAFVLGRIVALPLQDLPAHNTNVAIVKMVFTALLALGGLFVFIVSAEGAIDSMWEGIAGLFIISAYIALSTQSPPKDKEERKSEKKRVAVPSFNRAVPIEH